MEGTVDDSRQTLQEIYNSIMELGKYRFSKFESRYKSLVAQIDSNVSRIHFFGFMNAWIELQWIGRVYRFLTAGFATLADSGILCTSLVRDVLNLHMLEMDEDGFIHQATQAVMEDQAQQDCNGDGSSSTSTTSTGSGDGTTTTSTTTASSDAEEQFQLTIQNLGGLFFLLYSIIGVSILMAL